MKTEKILIIEDDPSVCSALDVLFRGAGYQIETARNGQSAIQILSKKTFALCMIDLRLPDIGGIAVLEEIRKIQPDAVCIMVTGYGTVELTVRAMKAGAFEFITKPFDCDVVLELVEKSLRERWLKEMKPAVDPSSMVPKGLHNMIGQSRNMRRIYSMVEKIRDSNSTILILGESGTGKEVLAKAIHQNGSRRDKPFIPVNCSAIPDTMLESELFGHEKGAFTGALSSRVGRFELAHQGTLFLDEIGEMPLSLQVKLLRVLQERAFERLGGTRTIQVDVHVIAATNKNLELSILENQFREDLFYRLNVIPIEIPPLRERKEDISLLVAHFLEKYNKKKGRNVQGFTEGAHEFLLGHHWPGNIRELENLIERLVTLIQEGLISPGDLPSVFTQNQGQGVVSKIFLPDEGVNFSETVLEFEKQILEQALVKSKGIKKRAALLLQMNRTTLVERLKRRGISTPP